MSTPRPASGAERAVALMHPDGEVCVARVVGARDADRPPEAQAAAPADLLWLAPSAGECRSAGWLAAAAARVDHGLAPDGIAYLLPPPRWRGRLAAGLRAAGFEVGPPVCHVSAGSVDRFLFSLGRAEARLLAATGFNLDPRLGRLARALAGVPGWPALAAELWPTVGFVVRRAGSRPAWQWLTEAGAAAPSGFVVVNGWRGPGDSTRVHVLAGTGRAHVAVAKVARLGSLVDEAAVLAALGDAARAAGATLPRVLGSTRVGGRRVVLLSVVPGVRAWEQLRGRPRAVAPTLALVAGWLERWNAGTRADAPLGAAEVEAHLLRPLAQLGPLLADGDAYAARVRALAGRLGSAPVPRVAAHNDLTMHNVLLAGPPPVRDALGVVDWEAARPDGWPLTDLEYAAVDVVAAAGGYRDRAGAWRACFAPAGGPAGRAAGGVAGALAAARARLAAALGMPEPFVELCHHACWLHHAANEQQAAQGAAKAGPHPFLDVLRLVAASTAPGRE